MSKFCRNDFHSLVLLNMQGFIKVAYGFALFFVARWHPLRFLMARHNHCSQLIWLINTVCCTASDTAWRMVVVICCYGYFQSCSRQGSACWVVGPPRWSRLNYLNKCLMDFLLFSPDFHGARSINPSDFSSSTIMRLTLLISSQISQHLFDVSVDCRLLVLLIWYINCGRLTEMILTSLFCYNSSSSW